VQYIRELDALILDYRNILHDPTAYPDPHAFKPERYMLPDGTIKDDPALVCAFGLGKRYVQKFGFSPAYLLRQELIIF